MDLVINKLFLRQVQLFSGLSDHDMERLLNISSEKEFKENEVIFYANDPGSSLFILKSGLAKISICDEKGSEDILKILYPCDFFGEMSLLDGMHRSATVTSIEKSTALIIKRDQLCSTIMKYPQIALNMLAMLSIRLRKADEKIACLRFSDACGKVARAILDLSNRNSVKGEKDAEIGLTLSRQNLADFAGVTRETLTRILMEFQNSGCLKVDKRKITILKEAELKKKL